MQTETSDTPDTTEPMDDIGELYVSSTVQRLPRNRRPSPSTVCETCPASVWYTMQSQVKCYCRVMHLHSWDSEEPKPLTSCDGREAALAELMNPEA